MTVQLGNFKCVWLLILGVFILGVTDLSGQALEIRSHSGYTFAHRFPFENGRARIFGGFTYGASLEYDFSNVFGIEFLFIRQETRVTAQSTTPVIDVDEPAVVTYYLLGSNRIKSISNSAKLYGGFKAGGVVMSAKQDAFDPIFKFAAGMQGGVKYKLTDQVGLNAQANLNFPIMNVGAALWWSSGSGTSVGVTSSTSIVQFALLGGIYYRFTP